MKHTTLGLCLLAALILETPASARTLAVIPLPRQDAAPGGWPGASQQLAAVLSTGGWQVMDSADAMDQLFGAGPRALRREKQLRRFRQLARQGRAQLDALDLAAAGASLALAMDLTRQIGAWLASPRELAEVSFLLGLVHQRMDQPDQAARAYSRAAALDPDFIASPTEFPPEILTRFSAVRQEVQQARVCPVQVRSFPAGARVHLDGKALGLTPLTVKLPAGEYYLRMERQGHAPTSRLIHPCAEASALVALRKRPRLPAPDKLTQALRLAPRRHALLISEALGADALVFTRHVLQQGKNLLWYQACRQGGEEIGDMICAEGTLSPRQLSSNGPIPLVASARQDKVATPWYSRWWVWTALGVAVTAAVIVPLAISTPESKYVVTQESALIRW